MVNSVGMVVELLRKLNKKLGTCSWNLGGRVMLQTSYRFFVPLVLGATLVVPGCANHEREAPTFKYRIDDLMRHVNNLERAVAQLQTQLVRTRLKQEANQTVSLSPSEPKTFQRLDASPSGTFLVSLEDVTPYLEGFKVRLNIGNPSVATYVGFTLNVKGGRNDNALNNREIDDKWQAAYDEWKASQWEKKFSFPGSLEPARWNVVEFVISPAKAQDIGYLEVGMETSAVSLR